MKNKIAVSLALTLAISIGAITANQAMAQGSDGDCAVLGFHEPGTNIYDGPTFCGNTVLSYITVRGPLQLDQTKITGKTNVSGPIKANRANFQEIILQKTMGTVNVTLASSTTVNGDITFLGREGVVYLEEGSVIRGKIINGKVVNKIMDDANS